MKIVIRTMQVSDLPQVVAIENSWSYLSKWGEEGYMRVLRDPRIYMCLVAEDLEAEGPQGHSLLAGLAVLALLIDFCELCNLVVEPSYISKKVGYRLLRNCFEISQHQGISRMFLEVRASNVRAIAFYKANGFKIISQRRNYYRNPTEDAWVMERRNPDIKAEMKDSGYA
jgi:ribosomal-protein-alanine N-acetyltransferase